MIKLEIQDDLAQYIDTEELQRQAENEVKYTIKNTVTKMCQSDEVIKKIVENSVDKVLKEVEFSDEINSLIKDKILKSIENKSNWDISYSVGFDNKIKELYEEDKDNYNAYMVQMLRDKVMHYDIDNYFFNDIIKELLVNTVMNETDGIDLKEKLKMFVGNGIDKVLESLSC